METFLTKMETSLRIKTETKLTKMETLYLRRKMMEVLEATILMFFQFLTV
jgi:hypothetical protein